MLNGTPRHRTVEPVEIKPAGSFQTREVRDYSAIKMRFPLDGGSKTQLNFFSVSGVKENWSSQRSASTINKYWGNRENADVAQW